MIMMITRTTTITATAIHVFPPDSLLLPSSTGIGMPVVINDTIQLKVYYRL